jgi:UDP-glucose 4-epimerase
VRTIVTGGAGFIGSHVVEALVARGDETHVIDNLATGKRENLVPEATLHEVDIRADLSALVARIAPDAIVHLAAQADVRVSVAEPSLDAAVNVVGTVNVLEAVRPIGVPIVFASTGGAIYGECQRPARESDPCEPLSPYGAAKLAGEGYLASFARLYGAAHVSLRFGNVYGPRQDPHGEAGVVAIFLGRLHDGAACAIFGDGLQTRDYVYVGDVVHAVLAALAHGAPGVFNVGRGEAVSVVDLYDACRTVAGSEARATFEPARHGELQRSVLDTKLLERELGVRATTTLEDGLHSTWEWVVAARGGVLQA